MQCRETESGIEVRFYYLHSLMAAMDKLGLEPEFDEQAMRLHFFKSRLAMSGMGYIEGSETYQGLVNVVRRDDLALQYIGVPMSAEPFLVLPGSLDAQIVSSPEETEHTLHDAKQYLRDTDSTEYTEERLEGMSDGEIMDLAYDHGMGEGDYYPPDDDFAYHEIESLFTQALEDSVKYPIEYDGEGGCWCCDGEVLWVVHTKEKAA